MATEQTGPCDSRDPIPVQPHEAVYCHGCGHAWWADEECDCWCVPGDHNYERWVVGSPAGFEILWRRDHAR